MKYALLRLALGPALLLITATWPVAAVAPTHVSDAYTPLEWSSRMAKSEIARLGNKLCAGPIGSGRWDYTTGMYADALIRLSGAIDDPTYEKDAEKIIGSFIGPTGKIATYEVKKKKKPSTPPPSDKKKVKITGAKTIDGYSLDEVQSGVATLKLYDLTGKARYRLAADILRHQLHGQPRNPEGGFWHKGGYPDQMWLDGLYMGEPFYADYAVRFNELQDFDDIAKQFEVVGKHTYDPRTGLFYHGWDSSKQAPWANPRTGTSPCFWARAIGWYAMALVDVLDKMPADHPARPQLIGLLQKVAHGLLKYQDPKTGVWWQVADQGHRNHNYLEASASCMFVYSLAKGVNHGYLPRADIPAIRAGYRGIVDQFVTQNFDRETVNLTRCCLVAGLDEKHKGTYEYYTQVPPIVSNDLKGVCPFIIAGIECNQLFPHERFSP